MGLRSSLRDKLGATGAAIGTVGVAIVTIIFVLAGLWLEFGGIYHAFAHCSTGDGLIAVFVPPYAWYRSVEFFFWLGRGGLTTSEQREVRHFVDSIAKSVEFFGEERDVPGADDPEALDRLTWEVKSTVEEMLAHSRQVTDRVLERIHPDLPFHYRSQFCRGLEHMKDAIDEVERGRRYSGSRSFRKACEQLDAWVGWYEGHVPEFRHIH
jgi:hypothetical protein